MKPRRRRTNAPLPRSPLELAHPLAVPLAGGEGTVVLDELPPQCSFVVFKALRLVLAWARGPGLATAVLRETELRAWEEEVLSARPDFDEDLWAPLGALATALRRPGHVDPSAVAAGCMALTDWAVGEGAVETALQFAQAAALAWPENAHYAWIAGRLLRNHGRFRDAEVWLKRAARIAVWHEDWETQDLALNSLGNLYAQQGAFAEAVHYLDRALAVARRYRMKEREGAVTHDLFMVNLYSGELAKADKLSVTIYDLYGPDHPNLPKLAHDVALLWSRQGRFAAALPVLRALLRFFRLPEERLKVLTATARAAGACGERGLYEDVWTEAWEIIKQPKPEVRAAVPAAFVDLGFGAANLYEWSHATRALTVALEAAHERGAHDSAAQAETGLELVKRHERIDYVRRGASSGTAMQLADAFVRSLEGSSLQPGDETEPVCGRAT